MGICSDAMLFYGFSADDGGWEGVDTDEDWEVVIAAKKGLPKPKVDFCARGREQGDAQGVLE